MTNFIHEKNEMRYSIVPLYAKIEDVIPLEYNALDMKKEEGFVDIRKGTERIGGYRFERGLKCFVDSS